MGTIDDAHKPHWGQGIGGAPPKGSGTARPVAEMGASGECECSLVLIGCTQLAELKA
jgi:hypothetical protein